EEIARGQKTIHCAAVNVVGIHVIRLLPAELFHRGLRGAADAVWLRVHDVVFAVGLIPHGHKLDTLPGRLDAGLQLRNSLMREAISDSDGILAQTTSNIHWFTPEARNPPSTAMHCPVMKLAASEARRMAAPTNSSALPKRSMGVRMRNSWPRGVPSRSWA